MNAVPSTSFIPEIVPGDSKAALAAADATKSNTYFLVDPTELNVMQDFNVRIRGTAEWDNQVQALMQSIRANGYLADKPISVVVDKDDEGKSLLWVLDGHTRLEAVLKLMSEDFPIEKVPVVVKPASTNAEDMLVQLVTSNTGTPLTPMEKAIVVKRLQTYGWDDKKIGERIGLTEKYVGDLAVLIGAPQPIRSAVIKGTVSAKTAVDLVRTHGKGAVEALKQGAAAAGDGKKVMPKHVKKPATVEKKPRKAKGPVPEQQGKTVASPPPDHDATTPLAAIDYALSVPADGLAWLKLWRAGDADTLAELTAFLDPDGGL